ncbi:MAG: sugar ABC transporter permease [Treponema sp.]|jgi:sn-glycerol 3-phosphate transport system permease protein|nr:sugar ABC transporter permease [Treponema sp.]
MPASNNIRVREKIKPYLYLLPILLFAFGFVYFPFARTFLYSFSRVNFRGDITAFVGLRNYTRLFSDPVFFTALINTLKLTVAAAVLILVISYALALLAAKKRKAGMVYETLFIIPMAVSMPAASQIFKMLLEPSMGILNYSLSLEIGWFSDPKSALWGIVLVCVWIGVPFDFLLFLSALRNIPSDLVEAADLDGAGFFRRLFRLEIPLTSPTIFYVVCTNAVLGMMTAAPVMIITGGQPAHSTETLIFRMYTMGYQSSNYSLAACISIITFALTFGMVFLAFVFERKRVYYQ